MALEKRIANKYQLKLRIINIMTHYIIEGVDNLGKGTLIDGIQQLNGPYMIQHFERPMFSQKIKNNYMEEFPQIETKVLDYEILRRYQLQSFYNGFQHLRQTNVPTIFDRFHLGECVYGPLYRDYSGDYVFLMENIIEDADVRLILLVTSDFSFIQDDGLSFDFEARNAEQDMFISAFHKSNIENKIIIDVNHAGEWADPIVIRDLAINPNVKTCDRRLEPRIENE